MEAPTSTIIAIHPTWAHAIGLFVQHRNMKILKQDADTFRELLHGMGIKFSEMRATTKGRDMIRFDAIEIPDEYLKQQEE